MFWRSTTRLKEQINRITELHDVLFFNFLVILKYYLYITRADCSSESTISPSMRAYLFLAPYGSSLGQISKRDLFKMALSQRVGGSIPAFQDKPVWGGQELGHFYYWAEIWANRFWKDRTGPLVNELRSGGRNYRKLSFRNGGEKFKETL